MSTNSKNTAIRMNIVARSVWQLETLQRKGTLCLLLAYTQQLAIWQFELTHYYKYIH